MLTKTNEQKIGTQDSKRKAAFVRSIEKKIREKFEKKIESDLREE